MQLVNGRISLNSCLSLSKALSQLCFIAWIPLFKKNNSDVCILDEIIWEDILVRGYPGGAGVKNLPASAEDTRDAGSSLGWVDPLEKEITTYFSILAGKFYGQRSLAGNIPWGCKELDMWNENIFCHIDGQELSQPSAISGLQRWMKASKMKHNACDPADVTTFHEELAGVGVGNAGGSSCISLRWTRNRIWPHGVRGWDGWMASPMQWTRT